MTLNQLQTLTDEEASLCLYIVNIIDPLDIKIELSANNLTWFRKDVLEKKLLAAFPKVKPSGHPIYSSLLTKLGIQHEIKYEQPPPPPPPVVEPVTGSNQTTGSI